MPLQRRREIQDSLGAGRLALALFGVEWQTVHLLGAQAPQRPLSVFPPGAAMIPTASACPTLHWLEGHSPRYGHMPVARQFVSRRNLLRRRL